MNDTFDPYEPVEPTPPAQTPAAPAGYAPPAPVGHPAALQHAGFRCPSCGYDLTGAVIGGQCAECGAHIDPHVLSSSATNGMAIASMVLGICALALCIFYGIFTIILAPLGIIFGHIARSQLRTGRYSPGSSGFATTGLICSYIGIGLVLTAVVFIVIIAML